MEYEERIDTVQGNYIVASGLDFENIVSKVELHVGDIIIKPGDYTNLFEWFNVDVRYVGMLEKGAIFYLGQNDNDLFNVGAYYYDVTYFIDNDRILKSYRPGTARDCFLKMYKGVLQWR